MTAEESLSASGIDYSRLRSLIHPVDPSSVVMRPAPRWMTRLWGRGIQAMTLGSVVFVDQRYLYGDPLQLGLLTLHELTHVKQWGDFGFLGFALKYVSAYVQGRVAGLGHRESYMSIDLEVEARLLADQFRH